MEKRLICFLCMLVCCVSLLASCKDANREADNSQNNKTVADNLKTTSEPAKMMELNMNNLLLYVNRIPTTHSAKKGIDYILCDGSVYSMSYCYSSIREHMNFMDKFDSCDNLVWDLVEDIKVLGNLPDAGNFDFIEKFDIGDERPLKLIKSLVENFEVEFFGILPDEDIKTVKDRIEKTNTDSEYVRKKKGKNIIKGADYNVYCYISDKSDKKKKVNIIKSQNKKKKYRKISDKNATAAWKLVEKSDIFEKWKAG